jgi:hypothetical protein
MLLQVHAHARFALYRSRVSPRVRIFIGGQFVPEPDNAPRVLVHVHARFTGWRGRVSADGLRTPADGRFTRITLRALAVGV